MAASDLNVDRALRRRDLIYENVFLPALHNSLDAVDLLALCEQIRRLLGKDIRSDVLLETLRPVAGIEFHADMAWSIAWRLAGNVERLRRGLVPGPWTVQREREATVWQVLRAEPRLNYRHQPSHEFTLVSLIGTMCGMEVQVTLTHAAAKYIAVRSGFSKRIRETSRFPFSNPLQLVGLRLLGDVVPGDRRCPAPAEYREAASISKWNRDNVLTVRMRHTPCPRGFRHPCHLCAVGYRQCKHAVHPETYYVASCAGCGQNEALFDPAQRSAKCVECTVKEHYRDQIRNA